MIGRNINAVAFGLALASALAASPMALAQESIMLERIGAVRMASPAELRAGEGRSVATASRHAGVAPPHHGLQRLGLPD